MTGTGDSQMDLDLGELLADRLGRTRGEATGSGVWRTDVVPRPRP